MKIAIGISTNRGIKAKTAQSLLQMVSASSYEFQIIIAIEGHTIAENRSYIAIQALETKCDYLFFVDDDMVFEPDILNRLLKHKKEIIGVVCHSRTLPLVSIVKLLEENGEISNDLFKCKVKGTGLLLIDMNVFKKINRPWFNFETYESGLTKTSEDSWFCQQLKKAELDIWCDATIKVGHIGDYIF